MNKGSRFRWLAMVPALILLLTPSVAKAQCRPQSSFTVPNILDVYAKRHSNGTTTLWFVHKLDHEVLCGTTDCEGNADEYVWRSGDSSNSNVYSLSPTDFCGEQMILTPSNSSQAAVAVVRIKFAENYNMSWPKVYYPRRKTFDVVVDPSQVFWCECIFQLSCDASTEACGETATLLGSPVNCSIC